MCIEEVNEQPRRNRKAACAPLLYLDAAQVDLEGGRLGPLVHSASRAACAAFRGIRQRHSGHRGGHRPCLTAIAPGGQNSDASEVGCSGGAGGVRTRDQQIMSRLVDACSKPTMLCYRTQALCGCGRSCTTANKPRRTIHLHTTSKCLQTDASSDSKTRGAGIRISFVGSSAREDTGGGLSVIPPSATTVCVRDTT